jgi:hypothetical protein
MEPQLHAFQLIKFSENMNDIQTVARAILVVLNPGLHSSCGDRSLKNVSHLLIQCL